MLKRLRNLSGPWGVLVGVVVALLLVPSVAVATGVNVFELKGDGGNKAVVTPAGQLLTTEASAASSWTASTGLAPSQDTENTTLDLPTPASGSFDVVSQIDVTTFSDDGTSLQITACTNQGCNTPLTTSAFVGGVIPVSPSEPINTSDNFLSINYTDGGDTVGILASGYALPARMTPECVLGERSPTAGLPTRGCGFGRRLARRSAPSPSRLWSVRWLPSPIVTKPFPPEF